jgi:RNA polymerase sigma-70 factor (ECF subfamily)
MHTGPSDKEVISRVLQGDQKIYEVLVTRYQGFVFTIALRHTGNREDAEGPCAAGLSLKHIAA